MIYIQKVYKGFEWFHITNLMRWMMVSLLIFEIDQAWSENIDNKGERNNDGYALIASDEFKSRIRATQELHEPLEKNPKAQYVLGVSFASGKGVAQSHKTAVSWYRLSADQGFADAQYNLGVSYAEGKGVIKDQTKAAKWYRLAAEQGIPEAQFNLGLGYDNGTGGIQYFREALKWYLAAAEQGFAKAHVALGRMYANGLGVDQNYVLAYMWTSIGAANGSQVGERNIDRIAERMSSLEISEGKERARACVRNVYKECL